MENKASTLVPNDELLEAIRRTQKEMADPPDLDFNAVVTSATKSYWAERRRIIDEANTQQPPEPSWLTRLRERVRPTPVDYSTNESLSALYARRVGLRLLNPVSEFFTDAALAFLPVIVASFAGYLVLRGPASTVSLQNITAAISFQEARVAPSQWILYLTSGLPLLLAAYLALRYFLGIRKRHTRPRSEFFRHSMGALVAGLLIAAFMGFNYYRQVRSTRFVSYVLATGLIEDKVFFALSEASTDATGALQQGIEENTSIGAPRVLNITKTTISGEKVRYTANAVGLPDPIVGIVDPKNKQGDISYNDVELFRLAVGKFGTLYGDTVEFKLAGNDSAVGTIRLNFANLDAERKSSLLAKIVTMSKGANNRSVIVAYDPTSLTAKRIESF